VLMVFTRLHLRELFSESVEMQPEHFVVRTGPYAHVRHPLYTAFFFMMFGQLLVTPAIIELLLFGFVIWHFTGMALQEEVILSRDLPGYQEYMAATSRFLPGL
jgi:protein-S-isoprenylcysteine O-methyltransferase Ste14